jgi:hypothetical protein
MLVKWIASERQIHLNRKRIGDDNLISDNEYALSSTTTTNYREGWIEEKRRRRKKESIVVS